jgi:hypothetical protein
MMVSFHGYNELRIEHVMKKALDDLRNLIWPLWKDGIETDIVLNNTCIVKFKNNPWDMGGPNIRQWVLPTYCIADTAGLNSILAQGI